MWQPISTAPKDGTRILVGNDDPDELPMAIVTWLSRGWSNDDYLYDDPDDFTHWMPLPPLPRAGSPVSPHLNLDASLALAKAEGMDGVHDTIMFADHSCVYVGFYPGDDHVTLDGKFTIPLLEEIIAFMRNHPTKG